MKAPTISSCYISCPMSVPQQTLDAFVEAARKELGIDVHYWHRNTDYFAVGVRHVIEVVDAFIVILPNNAFKHPISSLPSGTRSELMHAISAKEESEGSKEKHLFIGYLAGTDKKPTFYSATCSISGLIEGVTGSRYNFAEYCKNYKTRTAEEAHDDLIDSYTEIRKGRSVNKVSSRNRTVTKEENQQSPLESFKMIMLDLTDKRVLLLRSH